MGKLKKSSFLGNSWDRTWTHPPGTEPRPLQGRIASCRRFLKRQSQKYRFSGSASDSNLSNIFIFKN
jgi:hypothetical protein